MKKFGVVALMLVFCSRLFGATVSLVNTNIVGAVNETTAEVWTIDDISSTNNYYIQNSTITAEAGSDISLHVPPNRHQFSLGNSVLRSSSDTVHDVKVLDSSVIASDGGNLLLDPDYAAAGRRFYAYGGNGLYCIYGKRAWWRCYCYRCCWNG
ncbi:MAG: hypothetical protein JXR40_03755 [Pontiellaceae bacterium]|nr:hypothetical protein [Pontiellaceae bacterium]